MSIDMVKKQGKDNLR